MTMMGWMCGVTEKDKIRNEHVRGSVKWHMYTIAAKTKTYEFCKVTTKTYPHFLNEVKALHIL